MGSDLTVVNAARVSFGKHTDKFTAKDEKLIQYLAKHNHWSPFAHCFMQFRIKAPIFVARQLVKHQVGLTWNEVSRRYVDDEPEFYYPKEWRAKPVNSKQGSNGKAQSQYFPDKYVIDCSQLAMHNYRKMINQGIAPEQARMILPQNTMTEWYWSGSLMAFARVCNQRLDPHTQEETQTIAGYISEHIWSLYPNSYLALIGEKDELQRVSEEG
jgi:thymidylate synthase (FAD)